MVGDAFRHADEREMAVVQRTHRRDQRDALSPLLQCRNGTVQHRDVTDDLHGSSPSDIGATISLRARAAHAAPTGKSQRPLTSFATTPQPHRPNLERAAGREKELHY